MEQLHKTPTHQLLGWTEKQYDLKVFQLMFNWSSYHCNRCIKRQQQLLANPLINKWFLSEYSKLLKEFKNCLKPYLNNKSVTNIDKQKLWFGTVDKICELHPSALIKRI